MFWAPSRRTFETFFGNPGSGTTRESYVRNTGIPALKQATLSGFAGRLFKINREQESREKLNAPLEEIINPVPDWTIDQDAQTAESTSKSFAGGQHSHSSDGLGEGLVSLLFIIDSLYDSQPGSIVVIDEPELSLHPQRLRRLQRLLGEQARDRQIICATHSPYMLNWEDFASGASIARVFKSEHGSQVRSVAGDLLRKIAKQTTNLNNPHLLGLQANEVFFLEDRVVLVEGQEDVIFLEKVTRDLGTNLPGAFYGWGVGGASNMPLFAEMLQQLGYERVVGILDNDQADLRQSLISTFHNYRFFAIAADDVRPKKERHIAAKEGLVDESGQLRAEYRQHTEDLLASASEYLGREGDSGVNL